ncbi:MAG: pirin family protein [Pseudomonadota bacterium]
MSFQEAGPAECRSSEGSVELTIRPKLKDLGEFSVRRVLPAAQRRSVGPFVFFDHMGPAVFPPGQGIAVRPHPHIGLATITYLFEGEIIHRDSLGFLQPIQPGAVNLMTAGRGIVHSERAGDDLATTSRLHGIQSWMALPVELEEIDPAFQHYPAGELPTVEQDGVKVTVIMGSALGVESPVLQHSPTLYLECLMASGSAIALPEDVAELAFYVVSGHVTVDGHTYDEGEMGVACPGTALGLAAVEETRVMVIGGRGLGARHLWWNFVSHDKHRIEQAKKDWREQRFGSVDGDNEFIPLPE